MGNVMLNNVRAEKTHRSEKERIELVVEFGKKFDGFADRRDADGMLTLAAWAKISGLPDCGSQAYRAATAIMAGEAVIIRTAAMLIGNGGNHSEFPY